MPDRALLLGAEWRLGTSAVFPESRITPMLCENTTPPRVTTHGAAKLHNSRAQVIRKFISPCKIISVPSQTVSSDIHRSATAAPNRRRFQPSSMVVLCKYTPLDVSDLPAQVLALLRLRFAQGTLKRPPALLQLGWLVHSVPIVLKVMQCDRLKWARFE